MDFTYAGSGGLTIAGCAIVVSITKLFSHKFAVGSIVYSLPAARKGRLEKVAIKSVKVSRFTDADTVASYTDTYNGIWNEEELAWKPDAIDVAIDFWERVEASALNLLELQGCAQIS